MRLHIIRHADPDYEADALTPRGRSEAEALARRIAALRPARLFTSPLGRARQTAAAVEAATGLAPEVQEWAAEFRSPLMPDGAGGHAVFWNVAGSHAREAQARGTSWTELAILGSQRDQVVAEVDRVLRGARGLLAALGYLPVSTGYDVGTESPQEGDVVFICHGGMGVTWLADLLGIPLATAWVSLFLPVTSVSTVVFERRGTQSLHVPRAIAIADTSHLYAAGLEVNHTGLPSLLVS